MGIQQHEEISLSSDHSHTETNGNTTKGSSLAWKLLRRNFVSPEEQIIHQVLEGFKESRPYVLNPQYSSPTSLPLYFYFGYQLLQELDLTEECGPVSFALFFEIDKDDRALIFVIKIPFVKKVHGV